MLNENDVDATINDLIAELELNGSGGSDSGSELSAGKMRRKGSGKVSRADRKREKKERAMERQRSKFLEQKENANQQNGSNTNKSTKSSSSASNDNNIADNNPSENGNAFLISSSEIQSI